MSRRFTSARRLAYGLAVLVAFGVATGAAGDPHQVSAADDASKPFVVKIHADWCGTCQKLNATLEDLRQRTGDDARIVVLDVTDRESLARATAEADRLRIRTFFDAYKSKTGTVGILDGVTREPVSILKGETDVAKYEAALATAQGRAS
jgi:thiol-disulfide isomerase/thioredoxin